MREVLNDFPEEITETPETPAALNLFNVRDDKKQELLDKTRDQDFHHTVAQVVFTGIRSSKDAHTQIDFLTTRVRNLDEYDWKKLRRLLGYLK